MDLFRNLLGKTSHTPPQHEHQPHYVSLPVESAALTAEYLERDWRRSEWHRSTARITSVIFERLYPLSLQDPPHVFQAKVDAASSKYLQVSRLVTEYQYKKICAFKFR
ncbi:hypothetical protein GEMRC1_014112 [Eukaryota sp. GEM-RC1]